MVMSLLETWQHPMTVFTMSLWTRNPTPCSCLSFFSTEEYLVSFLYRCFAKVLPSHFTQSKDFHLYLSIPCVSSWSFPAAVSVLVFKVPIVMLSLPRIFDDAPSSWWHLRPGVRRKARSLLTRAATDPVWYGCFVFITCWVTGKVQPDRAYPSPGRTRGCLVHCETLPHIWPFSSYYEDIRLVMPYWHQPF